MKLPNSRQCRQVQKKVIRKGLYKFETVEVKVRSRTIIKLRLQLCVTCVQLLKFSRMTTALQQMYSPAPSFNELGRDGADVFGSLELITQLKHTCTVRCSSVTRFTDCCFNRLYENVRRANPCLCTK